MTLRSARDRIPARCTHAFRARAASSVAATVLFVGAVSAQTVWSNRIAQNPSPPPQTGFAMAAAPASPFAPSGLVILFGGFDGTFLRDETWVLNLATQTWANMTFGPRPSPRQGHAMAFDPIVNAFVLHGGRTTGVAGAPGPGNLALNDTWQFNVSNMSWQQLTTATGFAGPALHDHAMVFDGRSGRLLIFGGHQNTVNSNNLLGDEMFFFRDFLGVNQHAWRLNGTNITSPFGRARHAMTFDPIRQRVVMFGGQLLQGATLVPTNEFFEFDSSQFGLAAWASFTATPPLFAAHGAEMAFDSARGRTVFFGNANAPTAAPTMEWDGQFHTRANVPSLQTTGRGFVYDSVARQCAFFSGSVAFDTRTYGPVPTSLVARFGSDTFANGAACGFANGQVPLLDKQTVLEWQIGTTRNLRVGNTAGLVGALPPQFENVFVLASFGQAVPPIAVSGAPGCFQHIANPTSTLNMLPTGAQPFVLQPITIPNNPSFLGVHMFLQAFVSDANTARGFALSNAVDLVPGAL